MQLNKYEVTYIVESNLGEEATNALIERFSESIKTNGGEVRQVKPWGKRRFAYELKGRREGLYVTMHFSATPDGMAEVRRQMGLSDDVLRSMYVVSNQ